ncbi:cation:proton antiporter regulatory subunit [Haloprofundus halophilus]|uniref:cation:proton antiporter regulatory subunit n=1 Tax=Haloprofundus halophilus TaxID=2283527 RepID=UPI000E43ADD6|nr:TrkA C-terminal domain-containing protein [Haloprofundus halophilus]
MRVRETQLPGIGIRYNVEFEDEDGEFVIVLHNDGTRETFWNGDGGVDSDKLFELSESEAQKLAGIFNGTYFQPVGQDLEDVFDESRVRWIHVASDSPVAGQTIADSNIRSETGVSIIAIQRGGRTLSNPSRDETIHGDDVLVAVGDEDQHAALDRFLS